MGGFSDYSNALLMRDVIKRIVKEIIDTARPVPRLAEVISINRTTRKCVIQYEGETAQVTVNMASVQPKVAGQVVRIEGLLGNRHIADVLGDSYIDSRADALDARADALESYVSVDSGWTGTQEGTTSTTNVRFTSGPSHVFTAPASGIVDVHVGAFVRNTTAGNYAEVSLLVKTGSTVGSGTTVWDEEMVTNYNNQWLRAGSNTVVDGLTPGSTYNMYLAHRTAGGTSQMSASKIIYKFSP